MMTDDIRKLLGGYATGTLTEEERQALLAAALEDQLVFDALVDEQLLKELIEDGAARAQLLQATEQSRFTIRGVLQEWFDRPKAKVLVAVGAVLIVVIGVRQVSDRPAQRKEPQTIAVLRDAPPAPAPAPPRQQLAQLPKRKATSPAATRKAEPALQASNSLADATVTSDTATRVASNGDLQMKYSVLVRSAAGEFTPVPADYEFAPLDRARVRVELSQEGVVSLSTSDGKAVSIHNVPASTPTVLPYEIGFDQPGTQELVIAFLKTAPVPLVEASPIMQFSEEQRAAAPRAKAMAAPVPAPAAPGVTVRLQLRRRP